MSDANDDVIWVARCLRGDASAFEALVEKHQRVLFAVALRLLHDREDARDATQNTFIRAYERLDTYDPARKFFSWIYRIAVNESLNMLRRGRHEEQIDDDADFAGTGNDDPEKQLGTAQLSARLRGALMRLPTAARMVISLRHFSDCSYEEIGQILEIDEKTVKSRLYEARQRLREMLKDLRPE
jgi:RNA polymerase sigma-70 factor (ECF subfamily)